MLNLTRRVLRMLGLLAICCGLLVTASMGIGSFNRNDIFVAPVQNFAFAQAPYQHVIYLIDPDRLINVRILPLVDPSTITSMHVQWNNPTHIYIRTVELVKDTVNRVTVLYRHDLRTKQLIRLVDHPTNLFVGLPINDMPNPSPDGRYIAFVDFGRGDLYVLDSEFGEATQIIYASEYGEAVASNSTSQYFYYPTWSHDGRSLAYSRGDTLFVWTAGNDEPRIFRFPGKSVGFPVWSLNGQTIGLGAGMPPGDSDAFAARIDLVTDRVNMIVEEVAESWWMCGGQFLGYNTVRDSKIEGPRSFTSHLLDMNTQETLHLDDIPEFKGADSRSIAIYNCDQPEWVTVSLQPSGAFAMQNLPSIGRTQPIYKLSLLNIETLEVIPLTDAGYGLTWDEGLQMFVYTVPNRQYTQIIYKHALSPDAQPIMIGEYVQPPTYLVSASTSDYRYMIGVARNNSNGREGRLVRTDLQTGQEIYLTQSNTMVLNPYRWTYRWD